VGAGASFVAFVAAERRAEQPVVPLSVLRVRPVTVANSLSALTGGVLPAMMFFLVLYLQQVLGLDPLMAGLALAPAAVGIALGAQVASRTIERLGPARLFQLGALVAAASLFWLSRLEVGGSYWTDVLVPSVLAMAGFGAAGLPLTVTAATGLGPERAGLASGLLSMSRQVGSAVGLAALVAVASTGTPGAGAEALTQGFGIGLLAGAGLQVAACLGGFALPRRTSSPA
jgi:Na+/melibiose symporter-like transporter